MVCYVKINTEKSRQKTVFENPKETTRYSRASTRSSGPEIA